MTIMHRWFRTLVFSPLLLIACCSGNESTGKSEESQDTTAVTKSTDKESIPVPVPLVAVHDDFNRAALFLAGLPQIDSGYFSTLSQKALWKEHAAEMDQIWKKASHLRLDTLKYWQQDELSKQIQDSLPLFYPYSGPDFLHAYYFYPNAAAWHLIAIEPVILLPDWKRMTDAQMKQYLFNLRTALRDVIGKSYFITKHMMSDLNSAQVGGVLPVFCVFLARTGHRVLNLETIRLDVAGRQITDSVKYHGFRFSVTADGYTQKTLSYMKYDLSDKYLSAHSEFMKWVESLGPKNTFVKAASYLMHYKGFGISRDASTVNTQSIFQDDTGIPLKYMDTTLWSVKLYGAYTRPIKDFSDMMIQEDLKKLYQVTPANEIGIIPFPLGYHVVGDKIQNHQLFIRK